MKKWVFLIVFLVTTNISALEVDFSCPDVVYVGEEFECLLQAENFTGIYDAKVDISVDGKVIAEIWDDGWKSAYYYLYGFVDDEDEKKIKLRVSENYEGKIKGILKLREDGKREFFDFDIEIKSDEKFDEAVKEDAEENEPVIEEEIKKTEEVIETQDYTEIKEVISLGQKQENISKPEDIKTFNNVIYESKNEQIKKYSVFGFALLCLMLSILIIIKKL